jgi:hypothetical protein
MLQVRYQQKINYKVNHRIILKLDRCLVMDYATHLDPKSVIVLGAVMLTSEVWRNLRDP